MSVTRSTTQSRLNQALDALRWHAEALALERCVSPVAAPAYHAALVAAHFMGLLFVARLAHWPLWAAPALLLLFSLPALARRVWFTEALAALAPLYVLAAVRLLWVYGLRETVPPALSYGNGLAFSGAWAALVALRCAGRWWLAPLLAGAAAALYFTWQLWRIAPAGVTGSDPFAYVQMAVDLATHGSPRHLFPLAPFAASLGLPTLPAAHVGYVLPNAQGWAPTVWPPGFSALLAAAYRLGGERLLLGANAWVGLASLALTGLLAAYLAPARQRPLALAVAGVAAFILATFSEQFVRLLAPLADGAAQLFTTLAVVLTMAAMRRSTAEAESASAWPDAVLGALAGLALGAAFSVRYTQALAGPGLVLVAGAVLRGRRRWSFLVPLIVAGALASLPDLLYRTRLYGSPLRFGTGELALFSVAALPGAVRQLASELLRPAELGWLWVPAVLGAAYAWQRQRRPLLLLAAVYLQPVVFHLWYPFVRLRDVLFVLAPLAALAALGGVAMVGWLWRRGGLIRVALVLALFALGAVRLAPLLGRGPGFYTFGSLLPMQRAALDLLATLTEPDAVIAASLNSGAIELYGQRLTVRPGRVLQPEAAWTTEEWLAFVVALEAEGRPLYVLMDSPELEAPLAELQSRYALEQVALLPVPVFGHAGGSTNERVPLFKVVWP